MASHTLRTRKDFIEIPLTERRTKDEKSFVKIVTTPEGKFLSEWTFDDIRAEVYGEQTLRPLVYMADAHEAIEKSLWCYEHGMVPLIGEENADITAYTAGKYQIDQIITDPIFLPRLLPYLKTRTEALTSMSIIGTSFPTADLMQFAPFASRVRLVLALPETGVLAEAVLEARPRFILSSQVTKSSSQTLVVTKSTPLVTPIDTYDTGIAIVPAEDGVSFYLVS